MNHVRRHGTPAVLATAALLTLVVVLGACEFAGSGSVVSATPATVTVALPAVAVPAAFGGATAAPAVPVAAPASPSVTATTIAATAGTTPASSAAPDDADAKLLGIYDDIAANHLDSAMSRTDSLIAEYPNFRLAYMIRGDLLMSRARPLTTIGNADGAPADRIQDLREEAQARLRGYRDKPNANQLPRYLLQLRPDQKTAVVVDTRKSRLYLYENVNGRPSFVADYYITQGKQGSSKLREGDQKTPIGVYHITSSLPKEKLPDYYGAGALPINYPNEWDRLNGRTGHGIWLHGTPSDTYSRPPKASDGCVVLSNPDWQSLFGMVQVGSTPVVISDKIDWINVNEWESERRALLRTMESWRADWERRDTKRYLLHYSANFASDDQSRAQWAERKRQVNSGKAWVKVGVNNLSMLRYPGKEDMVVVTFDQSYRSNNLNNVVKKRQYWKHEKKGWKIVYEGTA